MIDINRLLITCLPKQSKVNKKLILQFQWMIAAKVHKIRKIIKKRTNYNNSLKNGSLTYTN